MTTSTITVSGLVVTPGFGQNFLHWSLTDPNTLTYRKLDAVEVHASLTNDRSVASKVTEAKASEVIHIISDGVARWYWIKARDLSGDFGNWFPSSSTGGVTAATTAVIASNGYMKLPNGLIIQWMQSSINDSVRLTWPIPFPNQIFFGNASVVTGGGIPNTDTFYDVSLVSPNNNYTDVYARQMTDAGVSNFVGNIWAFAVGY